jgi:FkbM family methyltransferase
MTDGEFNVVKRCRDGLMAFNRNDMYIGRSLELYGEYSAGERKVFTDLIKPGMTVLDVGANIGVFTLPMARAVGAGGTVIAFEPQRISFQTLCANVALNSLINVDCRCNAVGRRPGTVTVPMLDPNATQNFGGLSLEGREQGLPVDVITIDGLKLGQCHFMKIDVEGMEEDVIRGGDRTIRSHRPLMYVENDRAAKSDALVRAIDRLGYRMFWHRAIMFNPDNFAGNRENVFGPLVSLNMLCVPAERNPNVNLSAVEVPAAAVATKKARKKSKKKAGKRGKRAKRARKSK